MRALILAAGDGGRLHPFTDTVPKPLLRVHGRALINHVLDALFAAGVDDATLVAGYRAPQLRIAVEGKHPRGMTIHFVENEEYMLGNARSIWAARATFERDSGFLLAMADHLISPAIPRALIAAAGDRCALAIEYAPRDDARADEATRALVVDGRIIDIGKQIGEWNAFDTGLFWCTRQVFDVMRATPHLHDGEAGDVFATLAHAGELDAVDVTGNRWFDVDTEEDLRAASSQVDAAPTPHGGQSPPAVPPAQSPTTVRPGQPPSAVLL